MSSDTVSENLWLEALAAANPDDDGSLMRELDARGLGGTTRALALLKLWSSDYKPPTRSTSGRSKYVQGWRPDP